KSALGGLVYVGEIGRIKRSIVHRYTFPPQDQSMESGQLVRDPRTQKDAGEVIAIDEHNWTIDIKRSASSSAPHPTALIPFDIVDATVLRDSLLRLASWVVDHGVSGSGRFPSARQLLLRERPSVLKGDVATLIGDDGQLTEAAKALVQLLPAQTSV